MNTSLTRSIGFWLLLVLSLASAGVGGWLIAGQVGTMTTTLLDGTATGIEVYVGQSLVVVGAALLGAGVIGILIAVALSAATSFVRSSAPVVLEPIDGSAQHDEPAQPSGAEPSLAQDEALDEQSASDAADEDQNGSSGSTATATKISVK